MTDLSPAIKAFARLNEDRIKEAVMEKLEECFASTVTENYESKWDDGVKEHGAMSEEVLRNVNWIEQQLMEFKDAFWYEALLLYRASLSEGEPEN
jgi:hypothetical protein